MTRARIAAAALHSYPREFRAAHGPEMLSTALDASEGSRRRFARELADLVRLGLRRRAAQTARLGARRLVADAACLTASWFMVIDLGSQIAKKMSGDPDRALPTWVVALIAVTLVLTLIGYDRIAGVAALSYTAIGLHELLPHDNANFILWSTLVPSVCFAVLVLAPRTRRIDVRRLAWLAVPAALAVTARSDGDASVAAVLCVLIFIVVPALARIGTDPRRAIACALLTTDLGIVIAVRRFTTDPSAPQPLWFLAGASLVLALAITRTRRLSRRSPI